MRARQILLVALSGILFILCTKKEDEYIPKTINEFTLVKKIDGEEAREFINRLHLNQVAPKNNEIAFYKSGHKEMTLYLTHYQSRSLAEEDWQRMVKKISPENSVFIGGEVIELDGRQVYRCYGMGQTHFVFVDENVLIWFSTPTVGSDDWFRAYSSFLN
ncbi:hypothetical protein [Caldithrix abyssi]